MSTVWTLESLVEEIEREYGPLRFQAGGEEFSLRPLLRTDKETRKRVVKRLQSLQDAHNSEDELDEDGMLEGIEYVFRAVTENHRGARLFELLGGDLLVCMKLLEKWTENTQPGEAKDSPTS